MPSQNTEDDEALARKLQEHYELEQKQRRAERISAKKEGSTDANKAMTSSSHHKLTSSVHQSTTTPSADTTAADEALARKIQEDEKKKPPIFNRHTKSAAVASLPERSRHTRSTAAAASAPEAPWQDTTLSDEALAKKLQDELNSGRSSHRRTASSTHESNRWKTPEPDTTASRHTGNSAAASAPERSRHPRSTAAPASSLEATQQDTTLADEALARKLQDELNAGRSSHKRSVKSTIEGNRLKTPELDTTGSRHGSAAADSTPERSRHTRSTAVAPEAAQHDTTLADEALARKLQDELNAGRSSHKRSVKSTHESNQLKAPDSDMTGSRHGRAAAATTPERSRHTRSIAVATSAPEDTTLADEALARKLQDELNSGRSSHRRTVKNTPESNGLKNQEQGTNCSALGNSTHSKTPIAQGKRSSLDHASEGSSHPTTSRSADPPAATAIPSASAASPVAATEDDEALARKLQQEMKDEELARSMSVEATKHRRRTSYLARKAKTQKNRSDTEADGDKEISRGRSKDATGRERGRSKSPIPKSKSPTPRAKSATPNRSKSPVRTSQQKASVATRTPLGQKNRMASYRRGISLDSSSNRSDPERDIELALKLEQEDHDAALAQRMANAQARRVSVYRVKEDVNHRPATWTCRRCMSFAVPAVIILAAVLGLAFAFSGGGSLASLSGGTVPIFENGDPFQGVSSSNANRWNSRGAGLTLEVLNALNSQWDANFDVAVSQWDSGTPDALTLSTQKVDVDNSCGVVQGKLKVCNGDYGETKWRGINQVLLTNGFITSSVAKLNEFYLATADESQRQYTMCHEMGHGFGLPHTDENFYNADLGNCMDYTSNPEKNMQPDDTNYLFLFELYGTVVSRNLDRSISEETDGISDYIKSTIASLDIRRDCKPMKSNTFFEEYECDLKDGATIMQVNMLLAQTK